jgi:hypothetical protein
MLPLEKILGYVESVDSSLSLTEEDHALIGSLAVPLREGLAASRKYGDRPCRLRQTQISLDFQGNVTLCCGVFDARKYTLGNYLDIPVAELQATRQSHPMCARCMRHGGHVYLTYGYPELDYLALANIALEGAELQALRHEIALKRRQQLLARLYERVFSRLLSTGQKTALAERFFHLQNFFGRTRQKRFNKAKR